MKKSLFISVIALGMIPFFHVNVFAQNATNSPNDGDLVSVAVYKKIYSKVLSENRMVKISVPTDYLTSGKQYPVLYILDGERESFENFVGVARFLSPHKIPEMIIVGVLNKVRSRDLFSYKFEGMTDVTVDGADNFIKFLSQELIPFIDKNYRTTNHRTIYGQSAGGHFVTYTLLSNPDLFNDYLASSPAIGYLENPMLAKAESFFKSTKSLNKSYYMYLGKTDYVSVTQRVPILESIIKNNTPKGFKWGIKWVEGGHVPRESFYELILMLYADWKLLDIPVITPSSGEFIQGGSISINISGTKDPLYYTLNGEVPTRNSLLYSAPIQIDSTITLKVKPIRDDLQEGTVVTAQFKEFTKYNLAKRVSKLKPGLVYNYFEQQLFAPIDSISGTPKKTGITQSIDLSVIDRNISFIVQYDGYIKIPSNGQYWFYTQSTDAKVFIDNTLLTYSRGLQPIESANVLCLSKGYHSIRILCKITTHPDPSLKFSWSGPGIEKQKIPAEVLFHKPEK